MQSEMADQENESLALTPAASPFCFLIIRVSGQVSAKKVLRFLETVRREACHCFRAHFLLQCMTLYMTLYHVACAIAHSNMRHEGPRHADRPLSPPVAVY